MDSHCIGAFVALVAEFGIIEVCRTGMVALKRGNESILNEN